MWSIVASGTPDSVRVSYQEQAAALPAGKRALADAVYPAVDTMLNQVVGHSVDLAVSGSTGILDISLRTQV